jgi:hypothetical protein
MATAAGKQQWHATYWNEEKHGSAWNRAKDALSRDWVQTKADLHAKSGRQLHQGLTDTVKQVAGKQPIPPPDLPNPEFEKFEEAISYGVGAHEEYANQYPKWNEALEAKLATEWDPAKTGMKFDDAKPFVRRGWEYRK